MGDSAKEMHDRLLAERPEGAAHEPSECRWCAAAAEDPSGRTTNDEPEGGQAVSDKTYTEAELKAEVDQAVARAVAEATSGLKAELDQLKSAAEQGQFEQKVKEATAELEQKLADLHSQLDTAVLEAKNEKDQREAIENWLNEEKTKAEQEAEVASRKDSRLAKVREVANFPEEYLTANADRFAAMSDEDFEKACADFQAQADKTGAAPPKKTALTAAAEGKPGAAAEDPIREVMGMRFQGIDPRQIASREA